MKVKYIVLCENSIYNKFFDFFHEAEEYKRELANNEKIAMVISCPNFSLK